MGYTITDVAELVEPVWVFRRSEPPEYPDRFNTSRHFSSRSCIQGRTKTPE